jgi:hypothetical protein
MNLGFSAVLIFAAAIYVVAFASLLTGKRGEATV